MQASLLTALDATKRQVKLISLASVAAAWSAATLLLLLAFVLWDHWRGGGVPAWAGTTLRVIYLVGTIVWLTAAVVFPLVRHISDIYAARLIERGHPEFGNVLVSAVQLARREELPGSVRVAIVDQASRQVGDTDVRRSVPRGALRLTSTLLAAALVSFISYTIVAPKSVMVSIRRALGANLAPPTRTIVRNVEPADGLRVLRGQAVPFRVTLDGRMPGEVIVAFSSDGGATWPLAQQLKLLHMGKDGAWWGTRAGEDVQVTTTWRVTAGDGQSDLRRLVIVPEPAIVDVRVHYDYPLYTGLSPTTQPGGDIDALAGTRATFEARTNVPVLQPVLIVGEGEREQRRVPSRPNSARVSHTLSADILVSQDDTYQLQFRDEDGHGNVPVRYKIHARPDQLPMVDWQDTAEQEEVSESDGFPIRGRAQDDFGVTRAVLAWRTARDSVTRELPLPLERAANGEYRLTHEATVAELGLAPGSSADLWLTVWDNREDQGRPAYQRADSAIRHLVVSKPPASAPALARRDAPRNKPEKRAPEEKPAPEPSAESQDASESPPDKEKRTLQEFVDEHEKELALLERKLADEMKNEPGERVKSTLPDVVPAPSDQPGKTEEPRPTEAQSPREGQAKAPSTGEPKPDENPSQAAAPQPADAASGESGHPSPNPQTAPAQATPKPGTGNRTDQEETPGSKPSDSADLPSEPRPDPSSSELEAGRKPAESQQKSDAARGEPSPQSQPAQNGQAHAATDGQQTPQENGNAQPAATQPDQQKSDATAASPESADDDGEGSGTQEADGKNPCPGCGQGKGPEPGSAQQPGPGEQGAGSKEGQQGKDSSKEGEAKPSSGSDQGKSTGSDPKDSGPDTASQAPPQAGEAVPSSADVGRGVREGGVSRSLPTATQPQADVPPPESPDGAASRLKPQGRVDNLVDTLDRELRTGTVDPQLLQELGWDVRRAQQFVDDFKRSKQRAQRQQERSELPDQRRTSLPRAKDTGVLQGSTTAPARAFQSDAATAADELRGVIDPARQRVPARYRSLLEAYYRAISTQPSR